jgi:hypothetical protein
MEIDTPQGNGEMFTELEKEAFAAADDAYPETFLAPENEQFAEIYAAGYIAGAQAAAVRNSHE